MNRKIYQIEWESGKILYDPIMGIIKNTATSDIIQLRKNKQNQFPNYLNVTNELVMENFKPFCLTIYASNQCNLSCEYCYIQEKHNLPQNYIDSSAVHVAAEFIAKNCVNRKMPFILGFHGGNEPLLNSNIVKDCIKVCKAVANKYGLEFLSFCTTNGVISEKVAKWAARTFYGIRLSWDGPPDIHDKYRSKQNGKPSSTNVKRSAKIFLDPTNGLREFIIRTTITNESVNKLCEIIKYFSKQGAYWIEIYPAFQDIEKSLKQDIMPKASDFVKNFTVAKKWAELHDMKLLFTGSRLMDFHDKHCLVYQNNLTITPDGYLTACFLSSQNSKNKNERFIYGYYNKKLNELVLDWSKLTGIFNQISKRYPQCEDCFNYFHCSKGCPMVCPLQENSYNSTYFDCTMEKWISLSNIIEAAKFNISDYELNIDKLFSGIKIKTVKEVSKVY